MSSTVTMSTTFPTIQHCNVGKCLYNNSGKCCTLAINVGGPEPLCDTYAFGRTKGGFCDLEARVGACKVEVCMHNKSFECTAPSVEIMQSGERAECGTFQTGI